MIGFKIFTRIATFQDRLFWDSLMQGKILTLFHHFATATQIFLFKRTLIDTSVQKWSPPIEIPTGL